MFKICELFLRTPEGTRLLFSFLLERKIQMLPPSRPAAIGAHPHRISLFGSLPLFLVHTTLLDAMLIALALLSWSVSASCRMYPQTKGLSHGLKKCPPDTFLPARPSGRPFESRPENQKSRYPNGYLLFWHKLRYLIQCNGNSVYVASIPSCCPSLLPISKSRQFKKNWRDTYLIQSTFWKIVS